MELRQKDSYNASKDSEHMTFHSSEDLMFNVLAFWSVHLMSIFKVYIFTENNLF